MSSLESLADLSFKGEGNRLTLEGTLRSYLKSSNFHGLKPQKNLSKYYRDNLKEH